LDLRESELTLSENGMQRKSIKITVMMVV